MPYEYNPRSKRFDIPNPHRLENLLVGACALVCIGAAVVLLTFARTMSWQHEPLRFTRSLISAVGLLSLGASYAYVVMRQLRFFFGRGQPADLVPSIGKDDVDYRPADDIDRQIPDAIALRKTLQQNAIDYRTPRGPIDGLLYTLVRNLVFSPKLTQDRVQAQFRNLLAIGTVLVFFPISLAGVRNAAAVGWIGCFYFLLTTAVLVHPLAQRRVDRLRIPQGVILGFIVVAIVGPVFIASLVPPHAYALGRYVDIVPITFAILIATLAVSALLFAAGIANTVKPTEIAIAPHLETPSVNTTPSEITIELERELQRQWVDTVPNRIYLRRLPDVRGRGGPFSADIIEETQPRPKEAEPMTFARAWQLETTRPLLIVDSVCAIFTLIGAALVAYNATVRVSADAAIVGGALLLVGDFGLRSANAFWRRFEFTSRVYWIEWSGNFARAATKIGATLTDRVQTEREVITIETMTLRAWVADIDSVAYDTDRSRDIYAIFGLPDEASRIARHLAAFVRDASSVVAPTAPADLGRIAAMNAYNGAPAPSAPVVSALQRERAREGVTGDVTTPAASLADTVPHAAKFCTACGTAAAIGAVFCAKCGTRLA